MYFLTDEEKKRLLKDYLPRSREMPSAEELRGWNWHQPPLSAVYDQKLAIYEVANAYCSSSRDLYLRRVDGIKAGPNVAMIRGKVFHDILVQVLVRAKRLIYEKGVGGYREILQELSRHPELSGQGETGSKWSELKLAVQPGQLSEEDFEDLKNKAFLIAEFENARIISRLQEVLVKQPYIGVDSLVALTLPVVLEQKLDGSFLGLSSYLSADAFTFSEPMILDLKFGKPQKFHRLATTGYAMVMESVYEFPVNIGCIVYAEFKGDRLLVQKDMHIIDDELRQWFVEERDEKMRMVYEELDPGLGNCYETCPYLMHCGGRV